MIHEGPTLLVVESRRRLTSELEPIVGETYQIQTAYSAREAIDILSQSVAVTLIDCARSETAIEDLLEAIDTHGFHTRVVGIRSDGTKTHDGQNFDEVIECPVEPSVIRETVDRLVERARYEQDIEEWLSLLSKKATLESEGNVDDLGDSSEYRELLDAIEQLQDRADASRSEIPDEYFDELFRDIESQVQELPF